MSEEEEELPMMAAADKANARSEAAEIGGVDPARLLSYIERVEHLEKEKKSLQDDIKEVFAEAKSAQYDVKALKEILKIRKKDEMERAELDYITGLYKQALGLD